MPSTLAPTLGLKGETTIDCALVLVVALVFELGLRVTVEFMALALKCSLVDGDGAVVHNLFPLLGLFFHELHQVIWTAWVGNDASFGQFFLHLG